MSDESNARIEVYASQETTFLGLNDRILTPLVAISVMILIQATSLVLMILLLTFTVEIVMKFIMRSNWQDLIKTLKALIIESPRKPVKN